MENDLTASPAQVTAKPPTQHTSICSIVVMGGFLAPARMYAGMADALRTVANCPVSVVPTIGVDWLPSIFAAGWTILLGKLDGCVKEAVSRTAGQRLTLVCHSAAGLIGRLYLSDGVVLGRRYGGSEFVERLVTLGTPHYNECRRAHGGMLACYANEHVPGAYAAPAVDYVSCAGRSLQGRIDGTLLERHAYDFYRRLGGDGASWGDGLVPVSSALLDGSRHIVLDGVSHHAVYGKCWYGSPPAVAKWWGQSLGAEPLGQLG